MRLAALIEGFDAALVSGTADTAIETITKDSRSVVPGSLFFATKRSMGHISEALTRGAAAVAAEIRPAAEVPSLVLTSDVDALLGDVAARFYGEPSKDLFVAGITGTNGKTTTTFLMESMAREAGRAAGVVGTISYRYGGRTLTAPNTTPGAVEIHGLLKEMKDSGTGIVAMEVSSHALDQKRVEGIEFDMALFTNLTQDHLDYHHTMGKYGEAKRLLFTRYLQKSAKSKKWAILNRDDSFASSIGTLPGIETLWYSLQLEADARLLDFAETIDGLSLDVSLMGKRLTLNSPLVGIFNASNILAACLFGYGAGLSYETIARGVERLSGVPGRLERVENQRSLSVFVDYAHTPDALNKVLELLQRLKKGRLIVIFGCGGDRDAAKRPLMGAIAARLADVAIVTSDNPRSEEPAGIMKDIVGGMNGGPVRTIESRKEAIMEGIAMAKPGDVVLIAGKGHEDYQIIGDRTIHFSNRDVAKEYL